MFSVRLRWSFACCAALALASCDHDAPNGDRTPPKILQGPRFVRGPEASAPLGGTVELLADEPVRVELVIDDGEHRIQALAARDLAERQSALAVGFAAGVSHTIAVTVIDAAGNRTRAEKLLRVDAPPLPDGFPPLKLTVDDPKRMEPGITFFNARGSGPPAVPPSDAYLVMVDERGRVVWFFQSKKDIVSARRLRNGNLLYVSGRKLAVEIDMLGRTVHTWFASRLPLEKDEVVPEGAIQVDVDTIHHEIYELPLGFGADFVAMSTELREVDDWPSGDWQQPLKRRKAAIAGDVVVEFNRDGTVVKRYSLFDLLDPKRVCYDSHEEFWTKTYPPHEDTEDWAHANAILVDPRDGNYVVSCRNQDVMAKIERKSGKLLWLCGPPLNWGPPWNELLLAPKGSPFEWSYHQHAPRFLPNGDLLVFDNGNGRATPPFLELRDPVRYSRAVEYRIDEKARTVEQVWSYGSASEPWYSFFLGGVEPLPKTGNVLITDGGKQVSPTIHQGFARIVEVTHTARPEIVFELVVRDDAPFDALSWSIYRSERHPSVYPPE
ncbi:MAG: aryl-sulfate sulfotransferase [Planctomycetes bacterium]|nr:aryl-sulfate sulfotransferase [Planctomycetota bacterium]